MQHQKNKLYRRRPLFEEAAYWFTAAVCNALLTNIPSACVITEEDRSGKYELPSQSFRLYTEFSLRRVRQIVGAFWNIEQTTVRLHLQ